MMEAPPGFEPGMEVFADPPRQDSVEMKLLIIQQIGKAGVREGRAR
jgi:hypothetical protein